MLDITNLEQQGDEIDQWLNLHAGLENSDLSNDAPTIDQIEAKESKPSEVKQREGSVITFPELLLISLYFCSPESKSMSKSDFFKSDRLLDCFFPQSKKPTLRTKAEIKKFYIWTYYLRLILDSYVIRHHNEEGRTRYDLLNKNGNDLQEKDNMSLCQYQSMLYVSTEYYQWLIPYLTEIDLFIHLGKSSDDATLLDIIKNQDNQRHKAEEIDSIGLWKYPNLNRYWFWRLDYYLWERQLFNTSCDEGINSSESSACALPQLQYADKKAVLAYTFSSNRSIEHLHPQDQSQCVIQWPQYIADKHELDGNSSPNTIDHDPTNSFGNLAMISQSFNSSQSNEDVEVKFVHIKHQAAQKSLQSIKMFYMYLLANGNHREWTPAIAKKHQEQMTSILRESYKH